MRDAWIVDVDGTVALRRQGEGERGPYDWDRVSEDLPNEPVISLVRSMLWVQERVIFVSGRNEVCADATWDWLREHVARGARGPGDKLMWENVYGLMMRPDTDEWRYAKDDVLKRWIYESRIRGRFNVVGILDDRDRVVRMWRSLGLTCLQVAEGDF